MIGNALDPTLKRRGFASRDLLANWVSIVPAPWNEVAMPDRLVWPRRDKPEPEGAILHLRCMEGHGLALSHEGPLIAASINRYFGYLLVGRVRLASMPIERKRHQPQADGIRLSPRDNETIRQATSQIEDAALRQALQTLGRGILGKAKG